MGLNAKVCFTRDMGLGFGWDLGLGFVFCWRLIIGKNTREEHKEHEHVLPKKRERKLIENLFFSFLKNKKVRNFIIILLIRQFSC